MEGVAPIQTRLAFLGGMFPAQLLYRLLFLGAGYKGGEGKGY